MLSGIVIPQSQATTTTIPIVSGDGVSISLFNHIGGGRAPLASDVSGTPSGTTLSPYVDFPSNGQVINVGNNFDSFFASTTTPPAQVSSLSASNFTLSITTYLKVTQNLDSDVSTSAIDLILVVGSDDGFDLTVGTTHLGSSGDRFFSDTNIPVSFSGPGVYPVTLLYAEDARGYSGLEFAWYTATSGGRQLIPQSNLYRSTAPGDQLINFDDLKAGTTVTNQFQSQGAAFSTQGGLQVTNTSPTGQLFVPVTGPNVLANPASNPGSLGQFDLTFVVPGSTTPAYTSKVSLYVIDAASNPARVVAYDTQNKVVFNQTYSAGAGSQTLVTITSPKISKVHVELGQGSDTSAVDNISFTTPTQSYPDLTVTSVTAPSPVTPGQSATIGWQVKNNGDLAISSGGWVDKVYASLTSTFDINTAILLGTFTQNSSLAAGATYNGSITLTVPSGLPASGYVHVVTDAGLAVAESNETNNIGVSSVVTVTYPDLTITATAPTVFPINLATPVSWTVTNSGSVQAPADWTDKVYLSTDQTLDANDVLLDTRSITTQTPLGPGSNYNQNNIPITLPANTAPGNYYLLFVTDSGNAQTETNENNNLVAKPISAASAVTWVDWQTGTSGTNQTATGVLNVPGGAVNVTYTGDIYFIQTNGGTNYWNPSSPYTSATVPNAPPTPDIIALSTATTKTLSFSQPISNLLFAVVSLNGNGYRFDRDFDILSYGQGYWGNGTLTKQNLGNGQYELDGSGEPHGVIRFKGATSSITWTSLTPETWNGFSVAVAGLAYPDLSVTESAPSYFAPGQTQPMSWTVSNTGDLAATGSWNDTVYLSTDATFDGGDIPLATVPVGANSPVAVNGSYTVNGQSVTFPANTAPATTT